MHSCCLASLGTESSIGGPACKRRRVCGTALCLQQGEGIFCAPQHLSWRLVTLVDWPATQMPGLSASQPFTVPALRLAFSPTSSSTLLEQ